MCKDAQVTVLDWSCIGRSFKRLKTKMAGALIDYKLSSSALNRSVRLRSKSATAPSTSSSSSSSYLVLSRLFERR
ncbi:hypothetical protein SDJN03_27564, partial [Cucurbita argyrosperma subsp. sororia]